MRRYNADSPLEITIKTRTNMERDRLGEEIHNLLKGNKDYVDNSIILNIDQDKRVRLWVYDTSITKMKVLPIKE